MTDSNFFHLCQEIQPIAQKFLKLVNESIIPSTCKIMTTWRSPENQATAYADGLSKAKPGQSPHECILDGEPNAKAFDWSIFNPDGSYVSDGTDNRYTVAGHIVEDLGLTWGGRWTHPDYDHAELRNWKQV